MHGEESNRTLGRVRGWIYYKCTKTHTKQRKGKKWSKSGWRHCPRKALGDCIVLQTKGRPQGWGPLALCWGLLQGPRRPLSEERAATYPDFHGAEIRSHSGFWQTPPFPLDLIYTWNFGNSHSQAPKAHLPPRLPQCPSEEWRMYISFRTQPELKRYRASVWGFKLRPSQAINVKIVCPLCWKM